MCWIRKSLFYNSVIFPDQRLPNPSAVLNYSSMIRCLLRRSHRGLFPKLRLNNNCFGHGSWNNHVILVTQTRNFTSFDDDPHSIQLYPRDQDQHLIRIYNSKSLEDVFNVYNSISAQELSPRHSAQVLSTLWDVYKSTHPFNNLFGGVGSHTYKYGWEFIDQLRAHPNFFDIVNHVADNCEVLDDDSLACSLYSLLRFQYRLRDDPCQRIIDELCSRKSTLGLYALSRLLGSLKREDGLYSPIVMCQFFPRLQFLIDNVNGDSELYQASLCLLSIMKAISNSLIQSYLRTLNRLLNAPPEGGFQPETLSKIFVALTQTNISSVAASDIYHDGAPERIYKLDLEFSCCQQLLPLLNKISMGDLLMIGNHINARYYIRPESFIAAYRQHMLQFKLESSLPPCLMCLIPAMSYEEKMNLSQYLRTHIDGNSAEFEVNQVYWYRLLGKCWIDYDLADKFWSKQYEILLASESLGEKQWTSEMDMRVNASYKLDFWNLDSAVRLCTENPGVLTRRHVLDIIMNYLSFRGYSLVYRHPKFEVLLNQIVGKLLTEDERGKRVLLTEDYTRCIAFRASREPALVMPKRGFVRNLSPLDIRRITHGTDLVLRNSWRASQLDRALWWQKNSLVNENVDPHNLWKVTSMISKQKGQRIHHTFGRCLDRMASEGVLKDSKCIIEIMQLIIATKFRNREVFSQIGKIIDEYEEELPHIIAHQFLFSTFACGTTMDVGVKASAKIIKRRIGALSTKQILDSALSLCFHGQLTYELIDHIFSVEFLANANAHIEKGKSRLGPVLDLQVLLMEINRAVCIDMPSINFPWFHQKLCEELAFEENSRDTVYNEVDRMLGQMIGRRFYQTLVYSPYSYKIDFLIHLDSNGQLVSVSPSGETTDNDVVKVAILLVGRKSLTSDMRHMDGKMQLKKRHLEILGYRVAIVNLERWRELRRNDFEDKCHYLENCLPLSLDKSKMNTK